MPGHRTLSVHEEHRKVFMKNTEILTPVNPTGTREK